MASFADEHTADITRLRATLGSSATLNVDPLDTDKESLLEASDYASRHSDEATIPKCDITGT